MALIRHGCRVFAVCPPGHPLKFVTGIENLYPDRGDALKTAIAACDPDIVVPCDEGIVWQLHRLQASDPILRPLIEHSLGPTEMYPIIRSRGETLRVASELGIRVPETKSVTSEEDLDSWCLDKGAVLKLDGTWAGTGVEIANSREGMRAAYRRLSRSQRAGMAWQRLLFHYDASALWSGQSRERRSITIQQFISGRPANAMLASWRGEVLSMVMVEAVCAHGSTGISTVVRLIQNAEIAKAARLLARRFELSGFYGLDFMLEQGSGAAYLIELNSRCTQLGHLRIAGEGDLAGILVARLKGEPPPAEDDPITNDTIAFFPQAFRLNPQSPYLREGYHDVPWQEPKLFRELLRDPWPHRQWPARIYRIFRPAESCVEMNFDRAMVEHLISQVALTTVGHTED